MRRGFLATLPHMNTMRAACAVLGAAFLPAAALAGETAPGPVPANVVAVYDGDTLTVDAHPWPGITPRVAVRVAVQCQIAHN